MDTKLIRIASLSLGLLLITSTVIYAHQQVEAQSSSPASTTPKLEMITPSEGQTIYGSKVPVLFSVENVEIVDYQQNTKAEAGHGHIHVWLDDQNPTAQSAVKATQDTHTFSDVAYGEHNLRAELVGNDHKSLVPPQVVTVKFKNQEIPSAAQESQVSGFDKKTAFVILVVVALVIIAAWWYTKEEDEEETGIEDKPKKKVVKRKTKKGKK